MHFGAILLIFFLTLLVLGPAAIVRVFLGLLILLGIMLALIWLAATCAPKDNETDGTRHEIRQ
jgi:hypothetical protein